MAELESKFRIKASATGFTALTKQAEKLAAAFAKVGAAGEAMGKQTAQGLLAQQKAFDEVYNKNRGSLGRLSDSVFGRRGGPAGQGGGGGGGGGGRRRSSTTSTGAAAAARLGHDTPGGVGGGGAGGGAGGARGGGGGGGNAGGKKQGFNRGLIMGGLGIDYLDPTLKDADAYKQAAGIMTGRFGRRVAGSAVDFALSASQGPNAIASALGGIPLVGGVLANTLGAGIQAARGETAAQAGLAGVMPYVSAGGGDFFSRMQGERTRLSRMGVNLGGMGGNETLARFAAAAGQSGGTTRDYSDLQLARTLMAQQGYGVDMGTSMRLLRGEATGQAVGSGRSSLAAALGTANDLGLGGAEVGQYLRRMAADLEEVNRTGIKFSAAGQGDLERAMGRTLVGAAGTRASEVGQSLNAGISRLAQSGPQNAGQAMLLQAAGYNAEDPGTYARAMRSLEDPTRRASIVGRATRLMRRSTRGYSLDEQAESYRQFMAELNANISHTEAYEAVRTGSIDSGTDDPGMLRRFSSVSDGTMGAAALANVPASARRTAVMANIDTNVGVRQIDAVQQADANAKAFTTSVQGAGTMFLNAANSIADLGRQLANFGMATTGVSGSATSFR